MKVDGDWFHSHQDEKIVRAIETGGWRPELNSGTRFGTGVYLARGQWHRDAKWMIKCRVELKDVEILDEFPEIEGFENKGCGNSEGHFERYLKSKGLICGRPKDESGGSGQNTAIRNHFLKKGIKAVKFIEYGEEVLVVYVPSAIKIVGISGV